jgi:precorrin-6B methylase 2
MQTLILNKNKQEYNNVFTEKLIETEHIFNEILRACNGQWSPGCGSYLFEGKEYSYSFDMYSKQHLLYKTAKQSTQVLEIGTYIGHSLLIMLLANPKLNVTTIDINSTYAKPSIEVLKKYFPEANITFIKGDSLQVLPTINKTFNLFHIDGNHNDTYIEKEFNYCLKMTQKPVMNIILDDIDCCRDLETKILSKYKILQHEVSNCKYPNCFMQIHF